MALGPMNKGDTQPEMPGQIKRGINPFPLTNIQPTDIIIHMWQDATQTHKTGKGNIVFTDALDGLFSYFWHPNDTNTPGLWKVWCQVNINGKPASSINEAPLQINDRATTPP